jgi:Prealbumin-like fold domain
VTLQSTKKLLIAVLTVVMLASFGASAVLANIPGSTFEGGDGNLVVTTAGNTDWTNVTNKTSAGDLATGANDNSFGQGTSENDTAIHVGTGSIPNSKADLGRFASAFQFVGGNLYLQLAWTRNNLSGTTNFDFEINQAAQPDMTTVGDKTLVRTAGDLLITYDFLGGAQKPTLGIRTWTGSVWGASTAISSTVGEAEVNRTGSVSDVPIGGSSTVPAFAFGEANINLTAAGVVPANACEGFSSIYVKSRSSDSFSAALKDFIAPTPVSISNCGTVTVIKHTNPGGLDQAFPFTSTVTGTGAAASYNLNDAGTDTKTVTNVPVGSYTVTEGADPAGFAFASVTCVANSGATQSTSGKVATVGITAGGGAVTCTYINDQQLGAIKVHKTSSKGGGNLAGAQFSVTKGGTAISGSPLTTGADGTACVDGLAFGNYTVTETVAPGGYLIDDATGHTVAVDTNASCADATYVGETHSATDTPTADIQVRFRDGGSGETSLVSAMTCTNTTGSSSTTATTGWDNTLTVTGISAPTTITCTIDIDP